MIIDEICCVGCVAYVLNKGFWHEYRRTMKELEREKSRAPVPETGGQPVGPLARFLLRHIDCYQKVSPEIRERMGVGSICRFEPSCSHYAKESIERYGALMGSVGAMERLVRCGNPLSKDRYDPVL